MGVTAVTGNYESTQTARSVGNVQIAVDSYGNVRTTAVATVGGGVTYTDKTITSATGSSQTLAAANASRKSILIKNGAAMTGVNLLGTTAAIGGAATITLTPYETLFLSGADCPVGAITVISTAAAYISAFEGA